MQELAKEIYNIFLHSHRVLATPIGDRIARMSKAYMNEPVRVLIWIFMVAMRGAQRAYAAGSRPRSYKVPMQV